MVETLILVAIGLTAWAGASNLRAHHARRRSQRIAIPVTSERWYKRRTLR
jgi:predicted phosphoribosyltransferase